MKQKRTTILIISIILGFILLTEILVGYFFPKLTFVNGNLTIANRVLGYFAFSGFIICIPILFKATKSLTILLGVILFMIFLLIHVLKFILLIQQLNRKMFQF
ncbi:hypothetical protein [Flavobacterium channae]|uniref:hypothetical protein n=1 Tax=Flavobacterium channae TaxID=2897181 RepID=UPI001E60BD7F|nr:hypothetical protein [Flavobacterium channae]UGS24798.1 hypothetical protein LOS89_05875 [Flavobacterium channae]